MGVSACWPRFRGGEFVSIAMVKCIFRLVHTKVYLWAGEIAGSVSGVLLRDGDGLRPQDPLLDLGALRRWNAPINLTSRQFRTQQLIILTNVLMRLIILTNVLLIFMILANVWKLISFFGSCAFLHLTMAVFELLAERRHVG